MHVETTILDDLEVTIEFAIGRAEPDVGIMSDYVDEWEITEVCGRTCKKVPYTLYAKISDTKGEESRILDACYAVFE